jgi:hypothetical protein
MQGNNPWGHRPSLTGIAQCVWVWRDRPHLHATPLPSFHPNDSPLCQSYQWIKREHPIFASGAGIARTTRKNGERMLILRAQSARKMSVLNDSRSNRMIQRLRLPHLLNRDKSIALFQQLGNYQSGDRCHIFPTVITVVQDNQ